MRFLFALALIIVIGASAISSHAETVSDLMVKYQGQNKDVMTLVMSVNSYGSQCIQGKKVQKTILDKIDSGAKSIQKQPAGKAPEEASALIDVVSGVGWMRQICSK